MSNSALNPEIVSKVKELTDEGFPNSTALLVANGELDEADVRERLLDRDAADRWYKKTPRASLKITPKWDLNPDRYYLALDGAKPSEVAPSSFSAFKTKANEIQSHLCKAAIRIADPWREQYISKSIVLAYRWANNKGVTPPILDLVSGCIVFEGGYHRFFLASHFGALELPVLVRKENEKELGQLLTLDPLHPFS